MAKVAYEFSVGKYKVLKLDGEKPGAKYTRYVIDGKSYNIIPMYDAEGCIAIEASGSFIGKTVEFE
jgi:hypothetical protein